MRYQLYISNKLKKDTITQRDDIDKLFFDNLVFLETVSKTKEEKKTELLLIDEQQLSDLKTTTSVRNTILAVCGQNVEVDEIAKEIGDPVIVFRKSLYEMIVYFNEAMNIQSSFEQYYHEYMENYEKEKSVLLSIHKLTDCGIALMDFSKETAIASVGVSEEVLPLQKIEKSVSGSFYDNFGRIVFSWEGKGLILFTEGKHCLESWEMLLCLAKDRFEMSDQDKKQGELEQYSKLLKDTLSGKIDTLVFYEELKEIEKRIGNEGIFYFWVLVSYNPKNNGLTPESFYEKLQMIFGRQYMAQIGNTFHILLRSQSTERRFPENLHKMLQQFCETNNAFSVVSGSGYRYERIKTTLMMNLPVMHLGIMFREKEERVFFFQEYSIHFLIDFFAKHYKDYYPETGVKYLVPGSVYSLYIYDEINQTNLIEVLYTWLMNHQNAKLTAEKLFMHRNTVDKKLRLIEKISGCALDDFQFQYQAIFSYLIINYYEKMQKENFVARILPEYK